MGFTTHDRDLLYQASGDSAPVLYAAETGLSNSASESGSDFSVDNAEVTGFLDSASITVSDIRAGVYDNARVEERVVNWADLSMGDMCVRAGWLGNVKMLNGLFTAELRGLSQKLSTGIAHTYGPVCRAEFGSMAAGDVFNQRFYCNIDLSLYSQSGSVASSPDAMTLTSAAGLQNTGGSPLSPAPVHWFDNGLVTFTSGALRGKSFEVKTWDGADLKMFLPFPIAPAAGDTFTITPGCDRTVSASTGCMRYRNILNFRGEPFIPGEDLVLNYPNATP